MMAAFVLAAAAASAVLPNWTPTWNMPLSTAFMPCNQSGFTDPAIAAKFGLSDFDWSNAKVAWANEHPMDCEERLVAQAKMVKALNPRTKVNREARRVHHRASRFARQPLIVHPSPPRARAHARGGTHRCRAC